MKFALSIGAALLAASTALHAQTGDKEQDARRQQAREAHAKALKACEGTKDEARRACLQREICAQAKDAKACQERFAKGRESHGKARKACEGKQGNERGDCMRRELCAQAKEPAKCEAHAKEMAAAREKAREACKDKPADERRACMREHFGKKPRA
jgi:hypothetical protein